MVAPKVECNLKRVGWVSSWRLRSSEGPPYGNTRVYIKVTDKVTYTPYLIYLMLSIHTFTYLTKELARQWNVHSIAIVWWHYVVYYSDALRKLGITWMFEHMYFLLWYNLSYEGIIDSVKCSQNIWFDIQCSCST